MIGPERRARIEAGQQRARRRKRRTKQVLWLKLVGVVLGASLLGWGLGTGAVHDAERRVKERQVTVTIVHQP